MGNFGLELLYRLALPSLRDRHDAALVFIHWKLVSQGFSCIRAGDNTTVKPEDVEGSEVLPNEWNENREVYHLVYVRNGKSYLLKALRVDQSLLITFLDVSEDKVSTVVVNCEDMVKSVEGNVKEVYTNTATLSKLIQEELITTILDKTVQNTTQGSSASEDTSSKHEGSILVQPPRDSFINKLKESEPNPFAVGGGDLDPLGRGGGGMLMDPRHQMFQGGHPPQLGIPPNLPPGAVPPGARFDPFGPVPPEYIPPPPSRFNPPGVQPPPRGGFAGPDPDHLPPPGFPDMFM